MLDQWLFIARNAARNRRRSALTIASMAVSLCLLGVILTLYEALFFGPPQTPAQALRMVVHHKVSLAQVLPDSYKQRIASVPGVKALSIWQWFGGKYKDARDSKNFFAQLGCDPEQFFKLRPEVGIPDDQRQAFIRERTGTIASTALARRMGWKIGERILLEGDIFPANLELKLVGIYDNPEDDEAVFFNDEYLQQSLPADGAQRDTTGAFLILVDSAEHVPRIGRTIDAMFDNSPAPTKTESEKDFALSFLAFLGNLKLFLAAICGAVVFTILLVSANTVAMTVRERERETAILRTIGFTPGEIAQLVLGETALLALLGGVVGAAMAWGLCTATQHGDYFRLPPFDPQFFWVIVVVATVIGVSSAIVPAFLASRKSVVEAVRNLG